MFRRIGRGAAAAIVLSCGTSCAQTPAGQGWVSLFDGKTLTGWTPKIRGFPLGENYANTFRVKDGAIAVSYDGYDTFGERFGHLFFDKPFAAYRLRFEYRFAETHPADTPSWAIANSGVMIFSQSPATMALDDSFPVSVEAQLLGKAPGQMRFNGNVCSPGTHVAIDGKLETTHCVLSTTPAPPNGQWVDFEVEVSTAGVVTHKIDGSPTIVYSDAQLDPEGRMANSIPLIAQRGGSVRLAEGYIALQSEGNPIEFRRIEILVLR
jgi:hypothetical protein